MFSGTSHAVTLSSKTRLDDRFRGEQEFIFFLPFSHYLIVASDLVFYQGAVNP